MLILWNQQAFAPRPEVECVQNRSAATYAGQVNKIVGYIDEVSWETVSATGWVESGNDSTGYNIELAVKGPVTGSITFGPQRADVLSVRGLKNRSFKVIFDYPIAPSDFLTGRTQVVTSSDDDLVSLPMSQTCRDKVVDKAIKDLSSFSTPPLKPEGYNRPRNVEGISFINFPVGLKSSDNTTQLGKDGHLFLTGGSNNIGDQYNLGSTVEEEEELFQTAADWVALTKARCRQLTDRHIGFAQVVVPEKLTAMRELSPINISGPTPLLEKLNDALTKEHYYVSGLELFEEWHHPISPFQRYDSHLSPTGSLAMTKAIIDALPDCDGTILDHIALDTTAFHTGDLAERFFGIPLWEEYNEPAQDVFGSHEPQLVFSKIPERGVMGLHRIWKNKTAPINKSIVVFGNSFFGAGGDMPSKMSWWFARIFSEYHFLWEPSLNTEYINEVNPDFVVCQTIERFLGRLPRQ